MNFDEIKEGVRLQIECESDDPLKRSFRGIVFSVNDKSVLLITDYGGLVEIFKDDILSLSKTSFNSMVSDKMLEIKNYYTEIYELRLKIKELEENEERLVEDLYDANFLAKFNIYGAINRLDNSIDKKLLEFQKDALSYQVTFKANPDNMIEIHFKAINMFEYYTNELMDSEKIKKTHSPKERDVIAKSFKSFKKYQVEEKETVVVHTDNCIFTVCANYVLKIDVDQGNFLEVRKEIIKSLDRLKK